MAEHLDAIATVRKNWMAGLTDEEKGKLAAMKASMADEATKAASMAETQATFQAADTNEDGLLQEAELMNFMKMMFQNMGAKGLPTMSEDLVTDELKASMWALYNAETEGADGVSMADFFTVGAKIQARMAEL